MIKGKCLIIMFVISLMCILHNWPPTIYADEDDYANCKYEVVERVEPTETKDGYERFYSEICGQEYTVVLYATGRIWGDWVVDTYPTCSVDGQRHRNDIRHPHIQDTEILPALGHEYVSTVTLEATCNEEGITTYTCTHNSNETYIETIPALGHDFGEWIVEVEAKQGTPGLEVRTCSHNAEREEREIPALPLPEVSVKEEPEPLFNTVDVAAAGGDAFIIAVFTVFLLPFVKSVTKEKNDFKKYMQKKEEIAIVFDELD